MALADLGIACHEVLIPAGAEAMTVWIAMVAGAWMLTPATYASKDQCRVASAIAMNALAPSKRSEWYCVSVTLSVPNTKRAEELEVK